MSEFEFTEQHNVVFLKLASSMKGFGVASIIIGGMLIASGLSLSAEGNNTFIAAARGGQGIVAILVGIIWWSSSASFRSITETKGSDISYLMDAIKYLSTGFAFVLTFALLRVSLQATIVVSLVLAALQ